MFPLAWGGGGAWWVSVSRCDLHVRSCVWEAVRPGAGCRVLLCWAVSVELSESRPPVVHTPAYLFGQPLDACSAAGSFLDELSVRGRASG